MEEFQVVPAEFGQKFFGYSSEEILGRHAVGTIVPRTDLSGRDLGLLMDQILADPKAFEQNVNENMRSNGDRVLIGWTNKVVSTLQDQQLSALRASSGEVRLTFVVLLVLGSVLGAVGSGIAVTRFLDV